MTGPALRLVASVLAVLWVEVLGAGFSQAERALSLRHAIRVTCERSASGLRFMLSAVSILAIPVERRVAQFVILKKATSWHISGQKATSETLPEYVDHSRCQEARRGSPPEHGMEKAAGQGCTLPSFTRRAARGQRLAQPSLVRLLPDQ